MARDVDRRLVRGGVRFGKGSEVFPRAGKIDLQLPEEICGDLRRDQTPDRRITVFRIIAFDSHRFLRLSWAASQARSRCAISQLRRIFSTRAHVNTVNSLLTSESAPSNVYVDNMESERTGGGKLCSMPSGRCCSFRLACSSLQYYSS